MIPRIGIELEYAIVDRATGDVRPIADELLRTQAGKVVDEVEVGGFCWSNELVLHVIEIKTNGPVDSLAGVAEGFQTQITQINALLSRWNARLLPTAMHPWMDPARQTRIWPHDNAEIYVAFDRIFGCCGHGWSNLQSMHLNFPFEDDAAFGRLHAAIRLILPILPALAASSPFMDGQATGRLDNRLDVYRTNCIRVPSVTGQVIPEPVFTPAAYQEQILQPIYRDLAAHDPEGVLRHEWVNARGAIARFDRNTIEIRLIDTQECPAADIAIAGLIWRTLDALVSERWCPVHRLQAFGAAPLGRLLDDVLADSALRPCIIDYADYLSCLGMDDRPCRPADIWRHLAAELMPERFAGHAGAAEKPDVATVALQTILHPRGGPLARRILAATGDKPSRERLREVYDTLAERLAAGSVFLPWNGCSGNAGIS